MRWIVTKSFPQQTQTVNEKSLSQYLREAQWLLHVILQSHGDLKESNKLDLHYIDVTF